MQWHCLTSRCGLVDLSLLINSRIVARPTNEALNDIVNDIWRRASEATSVHRVYDRTERNDVGTGRLVGREIATGRRSWRGDITTRLWVRCSWCGDITTRLRVRHTAVDATAWLWCVINLGRTAAVVECCSLGSDQAVSSHLVVPVTNNDCRSHDGGHDLTDGWKDKNDDATYASVTPFSCISLSLVNFGNFNLLAMHRLVAASQPRQSETEPKWFMFETSRFAFGWRYCIESVASQKWINKHFSRHRIISSCKLFLSMYNFIIIINNAFICIA